ncbi:MAG: hypothetical protein EAZ74_04210 [Alphaproteobacteria bacterium]|nr:MAG: hypothetical protein EAZ74_04210 [Alphaproteobacteria bacterium]TAF40317.1 MAG: hypothetical protein EAZ66_03290 [Alphaproteobacteria bacterium]TAF74743.1 MAG: hypothetical protein EAZ52_08195 [Alphaproteobacteria bacterium]
MKRFVSFLLHDMRSLCLNPWHMVSVASSIAAMYLMMRFGLPMGIDERAILPVLVLGVVMIALINITHDAFRDDAQQGRIIHWSYAPLLMEWIIVARLCAYVMSTALPIACIGGWLFAPHGEAWSAPAMMLILSATLTIIACGLLCSALSVCFEMHQVMGYLLTLPFLFAVMMFATIALGEGERSAQAAMMLYALSCAMTPLALWMTYRILRLGA